MTSDYVRARFSGLSSGGPGRGRRGSDPSLSADIAARALAAGAAVRGDHSLTHGEQPPERSLTAASVLVPLIDHPDGLTVLLTQRTAHLAAHAGQVSFPGGRVEPEDRDAVATALRETREEVGLPPDHVETIGRLDTYITGTGFEITPIVGLVRIPFPLQPDPNEVAEIFEVPLDFVLDPRNHERHTREWKGRMRSFFVLPYDNRYIWGATAGMLINLAEVLSA